MGDPLRLRANLLLLIAAIIWGFAFVAQRTGMEYVGPFTFNASRFFVGGVVLIPFMRYLDHQRARHQLPEVSLRSRGLLFGGLLAGTVLFAAATLQQMGIVFTTAGKAGFITSLYVVLVPLLGLALGQRTTTGTWVGAILAAVGLYFLTMQGGFRMAWGDLLVFAGAFLWAIHVLLLGCLSPATDPVKLAFLQFMTCGGLSAVAALLTETVTLASLQAALGPILYTGILSVGIGYTLQVIGQRHARPAEAAIILSLEAVFAVLGGRLLLDEELTARALFGCGLMLTGILISQLAGQYGVKKYEIRDTKYEDSPGG
jgi:drug/metabolite transporter (DMT)-like permease